ncbi:hypothetical protein ACFXTH_036177 [Malus domestica]
MVLQNVPVTFSPSLITALTDLSFRFLPHSTYAQRTTQSAEGKRFLSRNTRAEEGGALGVAGGSALRVEGGGAVEDGGVGAEGARAVGVGDEVVLVDGREGERD